MNVWTYLQKEKWKGIALLNISGLGTAVEYRKFFKDLYSSSFLFNFCKDL